MFRPVSIRQPLSTHAYVRSSLYAQRMA